MVTYGREGRGALQGGSPPNPNPPIGAVPTTGRRNSQQQPRRQQQPQATITIQDTPSPAVSVITISDSSDEEPQIQESNIQPEVSKDVTGKKE